MAAGRLSRRTIAALAGLAVAVLTLHGLVLDELAEQLAAWREVRPMPPRLTAAFVRTLQQGKEKALLEALNRNRRYIRGLVAPKLEMKFTPEIRYRVDTALDYAGKIDELLRSPEVARDLDKKD